MKQKTQRLLKMAAVVLCLALTFAWLPTTAHAAGPSLAVFGGGGGGGGNNGANGGDADSGFTMPPVNGGIAGAGGMPGETLTTSGDGKGGNGVNGGDGVAGTPSAATNLNEYDGIDVLAGSGGNGGNGCWNSSDTISGSGGNGGGGGKGGDAGLTLTAPSVVSSGAVTVHSGAGGTAGSEGMSRYRPYPTGGAGGAGGAATFQCAGALSAPAITITKPAGGGAVDFDVGTLDVDADTTITVDGTAAGEVVFTTINVAAGAPLTIHNTGGALAIGTINITGNGQVVVDSGTNITVTSVSPTLALGIHALPKATSGSAYSQSLASAASGGIPAYSFALDASTLPAGLALAADGTISGTPTAAVAGHSFTVKVTDAIGGTATQAYTITVDAAPAPPVPPVPAPQDPSPVIPQTGDRSNLPLWALCGSVALLGLTLCGMALRKRLGRKKG